MNPFLFPAVRRADAGARRRKLLCGAPLVALAACGEDSGTTKTTPSTPVDPGPAPPAGNGETGAFAVDAGYGRVVLPGASVTLRASVSGGTAARASWDQVGGPEAGIGATDALETTVATPSGLEATALLVFEVTAAPASGEPVSDRVWIEAYRPAQDPEDLTALADFSGKEGWACDRDPVAAPELEVIELATTTQYTSNGIPPHATGTYPNQGNPNRIGPLTHTYRVPNDPQRADAVTEMAEFGITLAGIKLDRDTAESFRNQRAWNYEALTPGMARRLSGDARFEWLGTDCNNAHVQPTGAYHDHGLPRGYANELRAASDTEDMVLGGYAADGFPFYFRTGYRDRRIRRADWCRWRPVGSFGPASAPTAPAGSTTGPSARTGNSGRGQAISTSATGASG